ncbi:hypothetical protein RJ640_000200 [Escallonia rubra]|uniref:Uncharacterized protein n=1 Tax=Escallonia rubra TaxID=112253 RepID=A0AA88QPN9_9ASTE|nr:hypothetical protein RJ640_000200 [Escallonia rubra]
MARMLLETSITLFFHANGLLFWDTQAVIDARIVIVLVQLLTNAEFEIKREAACAMSNAISGGTYEQLGYSYLDYFIFHVTISLHHKLENVFLVLVGRSLEIKGCIKPFCDLAICSNPEIVISYLEGLEKILMYGEASKNSMGHDNEYVQLVEEVEGTEKIDGLKISLREVEGREKIKLLQTYYNNEIYDKAMKILKTYWSVEDDEQQLLGNRASYLDEGETWGVIIGKPINPFDVASTSGTSAQT